jgi:hypothetical protein
MEGDMGSPIFDSTFGTGRFKSEEPNTAPPRPDASKAKDIDIEEIVFHAFHIKRMADEDDEKCARRIIDDYRKQLDLLCAAAPKCTQDIES